jgi:hypothetical protein
MMRSTQSMESRQCYGTDVKYWLNDTKYFCHRFAFNGERCSPGWSDQPMLKACLFIIAANVLP